MQAARLAEREEVAQNWPTAARGIMVMGCPGGLGCGCLRYLAVEGRGGRRYGELSSDVGLIPAVGLLEGDKRLVVLAACSWIISRTQFYLVD